MIIDFLQCTFPDEISLQQVKQVLPRYDWVELPHGGMGYRRVYACGNVRLYFDGRAGMGTHLWVSGQGCRQLEASGLTDWRGFLSHLLAGQAKFTRFDTAVDDKEGIVDVGQVWQYLQEGQYSSHCQKFTRIESLDRRNDRQGQTVNIGSSKSDLLIRIYDKAAEQGQDKEGGTWVRVEMQARDEKAQALVQAFIAEGETVIPRVMAGFIEFKEPATSEDKRRDRWQVAEWWRRFLDAAEKMSLALQPAKRTLEEVKAWAMRQVAPSLALLVKAAGGNYGDILEIVDSGTERLTRKHLAMLAT